MVFSVLPVFASPSVASIHPHCLCMHSLTCPCRINADINQLTTLPSSFALLGDLQKLSVAKVRDPHSRSGSQSHHYIECHCNSASRALLHAALAAVQPGEKPHRLSRMRRVFSLSSCVFCFAVCVRCARLAHFGAKISLGNYMMVSRG
jgi:hypothetical protein